MTSRLGYHGQPRLTTPCLLFAFFPTLTDASPLHFAPVLWTKKDNLPTQNVSPTVWTPTVVIFVVFVGLAGLGCLGRILVRHSRATRIANNNPDEIEITVVTPAGAAAGGRNAARERRRRPHSVTFLPEYREHPHDEEVVIIRAQTPDAEGSPTPQPAATVVADYPSDDEDPQSGRGGPRHSERYLPIPTSHTSMPLLGEQERDDSLEARTSIDREYSDDGDTSGDISMQMQPLTNGQPSTSTTTTRHLRTPSSSNSTTLSSTGTNNIHTQALTSIPRPPSYFEVTGDHEPLSAYHPLQTSSSAASTSSRAPLLSPSMSRSSVSTSSTSPLIPQPVLTTANCRDNRSGIKTFWDRISMPGSGNGNGNGHAHQRSASSNSVNTNGTTSGRPSFLSHRAGSPFSPSSHSRAQSQSSLASPSLPISPPLTHTATRTAFAFPSSSSSTGLPMITPAQVKAITRKDAIGKFTLPYGPDAEAFAASREGGPPPPGFDDVVGEGSGFGLGVRSAPAAASLSRSERGGWARGEPSASSSTTAAAVALTGSVPSGSSGVGVGTKLVEDDREGEGASSNVLQTEGRPRLQSHHQESNLEPKLKPKPKALLLEALASTSSAFPPPTNSNGICASPSIATPTAVGPSLSEFGQILPSPSLGSSKPQPLSITTTTTENNAHRSDSTGTSSVTSARTYATAAESLPLNSTPNSRSSSLSLVVGGHVGGGVAKGWSLSSSEEEAEEEEAGVAARTPTT